MCGEVDKTANSSNLLDHIEHNKGALYSNKIIKEISSLLRLLLSYYCDLKLQINKLRKTKKE